MEQHQFPAPTMEINREILPSAWTMDRETAASEPEVSPLIQPTQSLWDGSRRVPILRLVGQIGATYLVAEGPDGLYLIDQHAAHERILFEKLTSHLSPGSTGQLPEAIPRQALLQPVSVHLPPASARILSERLPVLQHLGFEVEPFGPGIYQVRSMPALLAHMDPGAALRVVVEDFEEDETPLQAEIEAQIAARVCKRAAVKAGQSLSIEEQKNLLQELEACASPRTCPHGRPTMIHLSVDLLERQFGRRGAR
jgi:DNA mismatch repair protein MutL